MRALVTLLALALAVPLSGCGKIGARPFSFRPSARYAYVALDPVLAPQSQDALEDWVSSLAATPVDLLEVDAGALGPAALVEALAARGRPFHVLVERGPGGRALLLSADATLDVQEVQSQHFQQQDPGEPQGFLRVRIDGPAGTRHVVSVELARSAARLESQVLELLARTESLDGSVTLVGLPLNLGVAQGLLMRAGYVPNGESATAWTRGPLPAPGAEAPLHGPDLVLTFAL